MEFKSLRLSYSLFNKDQFNDYQKLVTDPLVMRLISGKALTDSEARIRFGQLLELNAKVPGFGYFRICTLESNQFIGLGKIVMVNEHEAEIGYSLLPENWGRGYGGEISRKLVSRAFTFDHIQRLKAIIDPENEASRKILLKCDFQLTEKCEMEGLPAEIYHLQRYKNAD